MKFDCILFDLGTLLDTNHLVITSMQYAIRKFTGQEKTAPELYRYLGRPLAEIMAELAPGHANEMVNAYREFNLARHDELVTVFPHVPETLAHLQEKGIMMGVVTSKLRSLALRGLNLFDLERFFPVCVAFEDTERHKPEAEPISHALKKLNIKAGPGVLMVGDSPFDLACAQNAGVKGAAVSWSLHPPQDLEVCRPDFWISEYLQLLDYV